MEKGWVRPIKKNMTCCNIWNKDIGSELGELRILLAVTPVTGLIEMTGISEIRKLVCEEDAHEPVKERQAVVIKGSLIIKETEVDFDIESTTDYGSTLLNPKPIDLDVTCANFASVSLRSLIVSCKCKKGTTYPVPRDTVSLLCVPKDIPINPIVPLLFQTESTGTNVETGPILSKVSLVGQQSPAVTVCQDGEGILFRQEGTFLVTGTIVVRLSEALLSKFDVEPKFDKDKIHIVIPSPIIPIEPICPLPVCCEKNHCPKHCPSPPTPLPPPPPTPTPIPLTNVSVSFYATITVGPNEGVCFVPEFTSNTPLSILQAKGSIQFLAKTS